MSVSEVPPESVFQPSFPRPPPLPWEETHVLIPKNLVKCSLPSPRQRHDVICAPFTGTPTQRRPPLELCQASFRMLALPVPLCTLRPSPSQPQRADDGMGGKEGKEN